MSRRVNSQQRRIHQQYSSGSSDPYRTGSLCSDHKIEPHRLSNHRSRLLIAVGALLVGSCLGMGLSPIVLFYKTAQEETASTKPDAIVVGSGLAGLAATLNILDRGGSVVLIEKEHLIGGNSNKATSGINACCPPNHSPDDSLELFRKDTTRSAGSSARPDLIDVLVRNSANAVEWLNTRAGVDLSQLAQLGGHSVKRTHRPKEGMVGMEIISGMQKAVREYEDQGKVRILLGTKVTSLVTEKNDTSDRIVGVECAAIESAIIEKIHAPHVILATGGFASDRSPNSYLNKFRPDLATMATTAGAFSTGDGITMATSHGAATVDMDKVQVHPTGFVDPTDPENTSKVLAAELLRGVGGILLNSDGKRFCNELGTRDYISNKMLSQSQSFAKAGQWGPRSEIPTFSLVLSSSAAEEAKKHVGWYMHTGLMKRLEGVTELAEWMGVTRSTLVATLRQYQDAARDGKDEYGKLFFQGTPPTDIDYEVFYAGTVTPVVHYCMGGISIDVQGNVLNRSGDLVLGLHAAGEVTGGVHGDNRLGGNSLLECAVFGTVVGQSIPITKKTTAHVRPRESKKTKELATVSMSELQKHNTADVCWVAIHGLVYDLTEFAMKHPGGSYSIHGLAGTDGTKTYTALHGKRALGNLDNLVVGSLKKKMTGFWTFGFLS